jgi:beta-galactosidase
MDIQADPQSKKIVRQPIVKSPVKNGATYLVTVSFSLREQTQWASKGFEIAWDQLELPWEVPAAKPVTTKPTDPLKVMEKDGQLTISGVNFEYAFSKADGRIHSMKYQGKELLKQGPQLNVWRAPLANEQDNWTTYSVNVIPKPEGYGNTISTSWYALGLDRLKYILESFDYHEADGHAVVHVHEVVLFGNTGSAGFENDMVYTISGDGAIQISHTINPNGKMPVWLPRIGTSWVLQQDLKQVEWFGRGPQENYPDRKTGYRIGRYRSDVEKMFVPYLLPEDCGLRTDNKWVKFVDNHGTGLEFSAAQQFNYNCYNYTTENLSKSKYTYQLMKSDGITFNFDYQTTGVGCTARSVLNKYQAIPQFLTFTSIVRPVSRVQ